MDTNSRSTTWHDIQTNPRGKALDEFLNYHQLHIINEDSARTTFQSSRGSSNIDLTVTNNHMLADIEDWEIMEEESCSDHNIVKYSLNYNLDKAHEYNFQGLRFIIKEHQRADDHKNLRRQIIKNFQVGNDGGNIAEMDERLVERLTSQEDVGVFIERMDDGRYFKKDMHRNVQIPNITKKLYKRKISPMVVDNSHVNEETNERAEKEIPKNTEQ